MRYLLTILISTFCSLGLQAQYAYFPEVGEVSFDKTIHVKNLMKRHITTLKDGDFQKKMFEELLSKVPETVVLKKKLSFRDQEYYFEHIKEDYPALISNLMDWGVLDYRINTYGNIKTDEQRSAFDFGGTDILIEDSLLDVKWKITDEYRNIAGYDCRRANGLLLDSVYVVAFYTDQIPISAGPSSSHGLPGMILGYVVPEQHYNIYASKVEFNTPVIDKGVGLKKKPKALTRIELYDQLKSSMGSWLSEKQLNLIMASIFL